jgi:hypothetical protein
MKLEYRTRAEVEKLIKSKSRDHAYIEYSLYTVNYATAEGFRATQALKDTRAKQTNDYSCTQLSIRFTEDKPSELPVYGVRLPDPFPNQADLTYALKAMQQQFSYRMEAKTDEQISNVYKVKGKNLHNLTLLVDRNITPLGLEEIKKVYPHPVELTDKERIDEALFTSDEKYAFILVIPYEGNSFSFRVFSALDCTEMGRSSPDPAKDISVGGTAGNKLNREHFKIFARQGK